ncbi:hypothetical protein [Lysinibacillus sp. FJAT-14222]|uniref:hypothetical protein n=1 Tax=Lysinibacillus sp. FJAT-14222 TaxID=1932366 RepID=UPI0006AE89F4|nr:hypothetical protein [Lysinibacillus sp. FJAT-14222]KOS60928.1 hypothetical protein AN161_20365 [Lysinibacillus sp. FJAT-14222]
MQSFFWLNFNFFQQMSFVLVATLSAQKTSAEIEELSLRTPRPVAIYLCESEATARLSDQHHAADATLSRKKHLLAQSLRTQLCRGIID